MGNALNGYGKPVYDDAFNQPADMQAAADFADVFANVRRGTSAQRAGLVAGQIRDGMLFLETDTALLWRYTTALGWKCITSAVLSVVAPGAQGIPNNQATTVTFSTATPIIVGQGISINLATGIVTISIPGTYRAFAQAVWAAGGASPSSHYLMLSKNDANTGVGSAIAALDATNVIQGQQVSGIFELAASDTLRLKAFQASGATKNLFVGGAAYYTELIVERLPG